MRKTLIILGTLLVAISFVLALAISSFAIPLAPTAVAQQAENKVWADFSTRWTYDSPEDIFTNGEATGRNEWHANIGSGVPLTGLALTLDSTLKFDHFQKENLTKTGPPAYVWSFGDVPAGTHRVAYVGFGLDSPRAVPVTFTPGFDASRSADKTKFSEPGTQTLTITLTPREATERFEIIIQAFEDKAVNPVITSPTSGAGIELSGDGHKLGIKPAGLALNTTWTITVTIQVTPKVPEVKFIPYVCIGWGETLASGTASGNSLSLPVTDMGTWTWSAEGSYEWDWTDQLIRQVSWRPYSRTIGEGSTPAPPGGVTGPRPVTPLKGNHVFVGFADSINYRVPAWGDSFTNHEVFGERLWRLSHTENIKDETGEPVRGLRITLDSDLAFDWVGGFGALTTKMGPPTYEWFYGDLSEDYTGHVKDANVGFTSEYATEFTKFTPGFDVSRSFDKTVFTAPDTQTVTVTVTPREESFDRVMICVVTIEANTDLVDAVIISHSEEWYEELRSGEDYAEFGGMSTGGIPVELNTPVTVAVTIRVTPKVPVVQFKPHVHVSPHYPTRIDSGIVQGSSFSFTDEAGTWTVSAEGEYIWNWEASLDPRGAVDLMPERGNTPPTLSSAGVSPPSGTPKTDFTFEVTYRDNDRPSYVRVYIDGSAQDMSCVGFKGQGYADGAVFSHTTALSAGRHTYYFEASDAGLMTARFPETGTLSIEVTGWGLGFIAWIVAGVVVIGLVTYFFIRRQRRRVV